MSDSRVPDETGPAASGGEALNTCREVLKRWQNRFTFQNLSVAKRYLEGEFVIHVHFRHAGADGVELCALLDNKRPAGMQDVPMLPRRVWKNPRHIDVEAGKRHSDQGHGVVLVGIVELPNGEERI